MTTIHDDLVFQILLWLPIAPLLRFKSVCKSWFSIIQTSHFIYQHRLHRHLQTPNSEDNLLIKTYNNNQESPVFSILSDENFQVSDDLSDNPIPSNHHVMVASCNGIICQTDEFGTDKNVSLWNPATQQFKHLPKSEDISEDIHKYISFVYDRDADDYKVVKFFFEMRYNWVKIYNLSTNSWRYLTGRLPITCIKSDPKVPYRRETYCWLGVESFEYVLSYKTFMILTFDIKKEVFGTMALPDEYSLKKQKKVVGSEAFSDKYNLGVLEIKGTPRLAIIREEMLFIIMPFFSSERDTNIWVLNDYGDERFWTKSYTLQLGSRVDWRGTSINGIIFVLHGEKCIRDHPGNICCPREDRKFCLYHTVTDKTNILPISEPKEGYLEVVQYKRSLVSIETNVPSLAKSGIRHADDIEDVSPTIFPET